MMTLDLWWLATWILSNTMVGGAIAILALLAERYAKRPALAHVLWVLVLVKLLTPPLVTFSVSVDPGQLGWISSRVVDHQTLPDSRDGQSMSRLGTAIGSYDLPDSKSRSAIPFLCTAWLLGTLSLAFWVTLASRRLSVLLRTRGRFDPEATALAHTLAASGQFASTSAGHDTAPPTPPVWLVRAVVSPMLVGTGRRAKIVFPAALWSRLDDRSRRSLLVHELEHWRRWDSLVRYVEATAWVLFWWHPLVWVARMRIEECEERCCDLAASRHQGIAPRVYAEAILATLDFLSEPGGWCGKRPVASAIGRLPQIEQRLRGIMSDQKRPKLGPSSWCLIAVALFLVSLHPAIAVRRGTSPLPSPPAASPVNTTGT